jgi:hypothetical protein
VSLLLFWENIFPGCFGHFVSGENKLRIVCAWSHKSPPKSCSLMVVLVGN